jgi:hypothetical protein
MLESLNLSLTSMGKRSEVIYLNRHLIGVLREASPFLPEVVVLLVEFPEGLLEVVKLSVSSLWLGDGAACCVLRRKIC